MPSDGRKNAGKHDDSRKPTKNWIKPHDLLFSVSLHVQAMNVVSSKDDQEANGTDNMTPVSDAESKRLTKEQIAKRERAELLQSIKKEREIFSQQKKAPSGSTDAQTARKLNYYAVLR
jgi:hypothetical protein